MSSFIRGMIAYPTQRNGQVTSREAETSCFLPTQPLFCFCFAHWRSPGVCIHPSTFWSATQSFLWAPQAIIPLVKEDSNTFHMTPITLIFIDKIVIFQCQSPYKSNSPRIGIEGGTEIKKIIFWQVAYKLQNGCKCYKQMHLFVPFGIVPSLQLHLPVAVAVPI